MRTNYIEYHLRLQNQRPKAGKLFAEEYPEPNTPESLLDSPEPSETYSFGSEHDEEVASTSGTQATSVAQTVFNVVRGLSTADVWSVRVSPRHQVPS